MSVRIKWLTLFFTLLLNFRVFTSEAYLNEHLAVIHPKYISDSIASGTKTTLMSYKLPPEEVYQGADCMFTGIQIFALPFIFAPSAPLSVEDFKTGQIFLFNILEQSHKPKTIIISKTVWWCKRVKKNMGQNNPIYRVFNLLEFLGEVIRSAKQNYMFIVVLNWAILIKICLLSSTLLSFESFTFHHPLQNLWAKFDQTWHIEKGRL